jgi:hypothetical protein
MRHRKGRKESEPRPGCSRGVDLAQHPHDLLPRIRVHRQEIDDVGPVLPVLVAVAHQVRGDRVTVGLVADQDAAEVVRAFGPSVSRKKRRSTSPCTSITPAFAIDSSRPDEDRYQEYLVENSEDSQHQEAVTRSFAIQTQSPTAAYTQASTNEATSPVRRSRIARAWSAKSVATSGSLALLPVRSANQNARFWSFDIAMYRRRLARRSTLGCYALPTNVCGHPYSSEIRR